MHGISKLFQRADGNENIFHRGLEATAHEVKICHSAWKMSAYEVVSVEIIRPVPEITPISGFIKLHGSQLRFIFDSVSCKMSNGIKVHRNQAVQLQLTNEKSLFNLLGAIYVNACW